ncbi:MAG: TIGR04282 family arsenosugar biosynthesis glycosyltransferase [Rubrivivax sp.]|nr:TIGR04282 family arsenosugar biosynthesis glycosyltransferase [Rubrivivax sp.]
MPTILRVVVMAKSPRPGLAKTRLAPALGAEGAARLAARMLQHALAQAVAAGVGPVLLSAAPDEHDDLLRAAAAAAGATLAAQGDGDLGARMARAAAAAHAAGHAVLILGTDAPAIDASVLRSAAAALRAGDDVVLVPAHDGGYALIGLARPLPAVFDGIAWSTPKVLAQTQAAAAAWGARVTLLAAVHDIDEPADLAHLPSDWRPEHDPGR